MNIFKVRGDEAKRSDERGIFSVHNKPLLSSHDCCRSTHITILDGVCSHNVTCFRACSSESDRQQKRAEDQKITWRHRHCTSARKRKRDRNSSLTAETVEPPWSYLALFFHCGVISHCFSSHLALQHCTVTVLQWRLKL